MALNPGNPDPAASLTAAPPTAGHRADQVRHARRVFVAGSLLLAMMALAMLGILVRVVLLQTQPPAPVAELIDTQRSTVELRGRRGTLLDRHGRALAVTKPATTLFVDAKLITEPATFAERVGHGLGYDPARVEMTLAARPDSRYIVLDRRLDDERLARLAQSQMPAGVSASTHLVREYPHGSLASQVIGFVGAEGAGLEGLERTFDRELSGVAGRMSYLRDASRRPLWIDQTTYHPPTDGKPVRLALDITLQAIAEGELAAAASQYGAQSGQIVVMQPHTGQVLAMANYPSFDPARLASARPEQWRNRAVTDVFEPGSIFKPFVWAPATSQAVADSNELIDCTTSGLWVTPVGRRLRDAHPNGLQTWDGVLTVSSNIGMAKVALRMGARRMFAAVRSFGFGQSTGSGLPGEVGGLVTPLNKWTHYSVTSVCMGQEIAVTPLQITRAMCVIANGGNMVAPTLVARDARPAAGEIPVLERILTPQAAAHTRQVLRRVVTDGTGRKANSPLYSIFGKTGTAQIADRVRGGYLPDQYVGSFICGAPVDDPQIVVGVFIHRPNKAKGYYGGIIAAPAAMRVVEQSLIYMGVPPQPNPHTQDEAKLVRFD